MIIKVLLLQSWFDLSIQYTGTASNVYEIATANNRSITDDIVPGESILIPDDLAKAQKEIQYYEARAIVPATGLDKTSYEALNPKIGIGTMIIGNNFRIE
jgi:hypothetical protein